MINQYKKKLIRDKMRKEVQKRVETMEGILWEIYPTSKTCRVRIQNTQKLLIARYPENLNLRPDFLKPGNAVKLLHTSGNVNKLEVIGHGQLIPTETSAALFPVVDSGPNVVLSGMQIRTNEVPKMEVWIETGTYRINNVVYTLDPMTMSESNQVTMDSAVPMDGYAGSITIAVAHSTLFRIDLITVGTDGVITKTQGTASATPVMPTAPLNHVIIGWVLIPPGTTAITDDLINMNYIDPFVSQISIVESKNPLTISDTQCNITVTVRDQYNNPITGINWGLEATFDSGNGLIDDKISNIRNTGRNGSTVTFVYKRHPTEINVSPIIRVTLLQNTDIMKLLFLQLLDELGQLQL